MGIHPLAGKPAPAEMLVNTAALEKAYYERKPDVGNPLTFVSFGTSGHRGSPLKDTFTETHILSITQAICDYRKIMAIKGPLFLGKDSHVLSAPAEMTALEVLAANGVTVFLEGGFGLTPTPAISRAILAYNRNRVEDYADGLVVTPSHNPPEDGGFKYNPPHGGPADTEVTRWIERRANELLREENRGVQRMSPSAALKAATTKNADFLLSYVQDLENVIDMEIIRESGIAVGIDPLGGASLKYWEAIADRYDIDITVVNPDIDPAFGFMRVDHDGKIRMDCSSPYAMAGLVNLKDKFDIAFGNDTDADRHGIVTPSAGLMNPNNYLAVAVFYLIENRPVWPREAAVGKTIVTSGLIDRISAKLERKVIEVPVGFKWFCEGLQNGSVCFGGEESAGASFLRKNGTVWTTDKDGLILGLLAAEITAKTQKDPGEHYRELTERYGMSYYARIDTPAAPALKTKLKTLSPESFKAEMLAGEKIVAKLTKAPGNGAPIDGLKVMTENGWFAARPSGTEDIYKLYAESYRSREHLDSIIGEAQAIIDRSLGEGG